MNTSKRDEIIEQLKNTWNNREQIKKDVQEKLQTTRATVEVTAKALVEQSKTSDLVHEYIAPLMESEKTEKAIEKLKSRIGENKLIDGFVQYRKEVIEAKVAKAKPVETTESVNETSPPSPEPPAEETVADNVAEFKPKQ